MFSQTHELRASLLPFSAACFLLSHLCVCCGDHVLAQEGKEGDGRRLLERCLQSQSLLNHVSMHMVSDCRFEGPTIAIGKSASRNGWDFWFRRDNRRLSFIGNMIVFDDRTGKSRLQPFRSVINNGQWVSSSGPQGKSGIASSRVDYEMRATCRIMLTAGP